MSDWSSALVIRTSIRRWLILTRRPSALAFATTLGGLGMCFAGMSMIIRGVCRSEPISKSTLAGGLLTGAGVKVLLFRTPVIRTSSSGWLVRAVGAYIHREPLSLWDDAGIGVTDSVLGSPIDLIEFGFNHGTSWWDAAASVAKLSMSRERLG
jgi:hypothetical protein